MALDTAGNIALGQLGNIPFDNIIGGPLNAAINAQAQAAETTVAFIHEVGLQEIDDKYEAITVQFAYEDAAGIYRKITVPILAIIPIPFIVIDEVSIDFKARISASAQQSSSVQKQQAGFIRGGVSYKGSRVRASLYGGYSAKKDSKASQESKYSVEYTMDVQVRASQVGITQGMESILNFLQEGTHNKPLSLQAKISNFSQILTKTSGTALTSDFYLFVTDDNGDVVIGLESTGLTISSTKGYLEASSITDVDGDGQYKITLTEVSNSFPTNAGVYDDTLILDITDGDDTITIQRPIRISVPS